jgi:diguanylate cyclase (GGDEF)-like protein/PAS domain S-box-containing protein
MLVSRPGRARPLILILDDELAARLLMRATLEEGGFDVIEAASVAEALERFEQCQPDLVMLDVILPDGDGISLCARLRALPNGRDVPISMVTGVNDAQSIQLAYSSGATDFITKPISWGTMAYRTHYLLRAHQTLHELSLSERKTRALLSVLPDVILRVDAAGVVLERQAGLHAPAMAHWDVARGGALVAGLPPPLAALLRDELGAALAAAEPRALEFALAGGPEPQFFEMRILPDQDAEAILVVRDISRRRQTETQQRLSAKVFDACNEAILISDAANQIISVNHAFETITGYRAADVIGHDWSMLAGAHGQRAPFREMWNSMRESGSWQGELPNQRQNGQDYPAWYSVSQVCDPHGQLENTIAIFSDISARKQQEQRIAYLAYHDELTGLPNRRLFADRVEVAVARAKRDEAGIAVLFVDVDRFKNINDSLGHTAGDELLKLVSQRLLSAVRAGDTVSRMGGDEFVLLCPVGASDVQVAMRADAILQELARPFHVFDMPLHVTASMGIACYPQDGATPDHLIRNADAAMYRAKEGGRNTYRFYTAELNADILGRLQMEMDLRRALREDEFVLYFQPQVDAVSGALCGAEALIRWRDPVHGLIPPNRFIPIAEEAGLIEPIGAWVLRESCRQLQLWRAQGLGALPIAVNVSARQFKQADFVATVAALVHSCAVDPSMIELELTESMLMADVGLTAAKLHELKRLGFSIAIDDFGTGFSSLHYLRHFPIDVLKIDQSFVREIFEDGATLAIVDAIIALAGALGMRSVAEGVETEPQQTILRERGCQTIQGYLVARPMPAPEFTDWVRAYRARQASAA